MDSVSGLVTSNAFPAAVMMSTTTFAGALRTLQEHSSLVGELLERHCRARQNDPDFGELAGLGVHFDRASMLLYDDVVADGETKTGAFSGRFRREERIEYLFLHVRRNTDAIVPDRYFDSVTEALGCGSENWLVIAFIGFRFALCRCVEAV